MKLLYAPIVLLMLLSACNKGANTHDGKMADGKPLPGYEETKLICTQCHALPAPDQFHPAAWPSVVARMEGHMRANHKTLPDEKQRAAILGYLQNSGR